MKLPLSLAIAAALALGAGVSTPTYSAEKNSMTNPAATPAADSNPFYNPSTLPLFFPHFDEVKDSSFAPAFAK